MPKKKLDKKGDDEEQSVATSSIVIKNTLYEQILQDGKHPCFAWLKSTEKDVSIQTTHTITDEYGIKYVPILGEEIDKKVVLLPTKPSHQILVETKAGDNSGVIEVLQEVKQFIHQYCDLPERIEKIAPYWVLGTYIYDQLDQFPILSFQGDTGTGKSRCKDVIGSICYKPIRCSGGVTPAAMYRLIEKWKGTVLIDEADFRLSDETADIIKLLNTGFERRSPVAKCDSEDNSKLVFFNPYCPKILTRRKEWQDKATESRCVNVISKQTTRKDLPIVLPPTFETEAEELRNKLITFRLAYWHKFQNPTINPLIDLDIEPRLAQANISLAIVLQPFPEAFEELKQLLLEMQGEQIEIRAATLEGALVQAFAQLQEQQQEIITASDVARVAGEINGKDISVRSAGRILKGLGFSSKPIKSEGRTKKQVQMGAEKWAVLAKRYMEVTKVTKVTTDMEGGGILKIKKGLSDFDVTPNVSNVTNVTNVTSVVRDFFSKPPHSACFSDLKSHFPNFTDAELLDSLIHLMSVGEVYQPKPDCYEALR